MKQMQKDTEVKYWFGKISSKLSEPSIPHSFVILSIFSSL